MSPIPGSRVRVDEDYTRLMTGVGRSYKERQWEQVNFLECRRDLARGSLAAHHQTQHGIAKGGLGQEVSGEDGGNDPVEYMMLFLKKEGMISCQFEGCSVQEVTRRAIQMHLCHRHVVILEEGNLPHPR